MPLDFFVKPEDCVTIKFVVGSDKNDPSIIYCDIDEPNLKESFPVDETTIENHEAVFKRPSFEDLSKIYNNVIQINDNSLRPNAVTLKMNRVAYLLKSWSLPTEATASEARKLQPSIAMVLSAELDRLLP